MQTYNVTFTRSPVVVLILILIPLLAVGIILPITLSIKNLPDWALFVVSFGMIGFGLAGVLITMKKWGSVPATVSMDEEGLSIKLLRWSPFYPRREYISHWDGLANVSTNYDPQHEKRFYLIKFKHPATTVSLDPGDAATEDSETPFGNTLLGYVEQYNSTHTARPETLIRHRGFYDAWWAKGLTVCSYVFIGIAIVGFFTDRVIFPVWRLIQVLCFSAMWLAAYYANRRHART